MSYTPSQKGKVLVVAGSDSGGGAGIQADIKSIMAQGAYATTAISALTAQNTLGVQDIMAVPPAFVAAQMTSILSDIGADMMKTGMLATREVIEAVAEQRSHLAPQLPMIVDPVMMATSGDKLLQNSAMNALASLLVNHALIVTPNLPEASLLTRRDVDTLDDMKRAADTLMRDGAHAALIKGGHGTDKVVTDLLATQSGFEVFEHERLNTKNMHGTGCTLASALAGQLANAGVAANSEDAPLDSKGRPDDAVLKTACEAALTYVHRAIKSAPDIGGGNGPLNH
ncbi:MAG: bifunctional hydroxymethylpyrimidine kinase/phosphomethylpyrimidine kinase [Alphaproteobacteria bacterium]|nr:bifunctional hydroxymethylpyrimidine kinase/phosphomethylpyrimidine kinase [Alphaproteobacteria bacterium]